MAAVQTQSQFTANLKRYYSFYTGGFIAFVILVGILEQMGVPNKILGYIFLFATIALYAGIGFMSKTSDVGEYYVAGRRVPALFNGMATGADWMSAASFIGMAGTLYLSGYDGLAFVLGWTGGYVLVAILLAPYLRKFGQFTIPDFLGARFGGHLPRFIGVVAAIVCSFTYVIAQIYGVGLITSRFTGLEFQVGVFVGLAGILVCSFLGGMKAVTWTQVAQYIILIVAYMIPVVWLSVKHTGVPIPQISAYTLGPAQDHGAGKGVQRQGHAQGRGGRVGARHLPRAFRCRDRQAGRAGKRRRYFPCRREAETGRTRQRHSRPKRPRMRKLSKRPRKQSRISRLTRRLPRKPGLRRRGSAPALHRSRPMPNPLRSAARRRKRSRRTVASRRRTSLP